MSFGEDFGKFIKFIVIVLLCSVPLALWKVIEIIIWFCKHLKIE